MRCGQQMTSAPMITLGSTWMEWRKVSKAGLSPQSKSRMERVVGFELSSCFVRSSIRRTTSLPSVRYTCLAKELATIPGKPQPAPSSRTVLS